jgi:Tol biopolymer transport system component
MKKLMMISMLIAWGASFSVIQAQTKADPEVVSANGTIAYSITPPNGDNEIYRINTNGGDRTQLTDHEGRDAGPSWSPDGSRIAFYVHTIDEVSWFIYVMDWNGDNIEQLTDTEGVYDSSPTWSPDGNQIAFGREYPDQNFRSEIWVMNANGDNQHQIDSIAGGGPRWSPNGDRIVFHSDMDGNYEIYTMDVDGENVQRLTHTDEDDYWPDWSPDGSMIVFESYRDGNGEIYTMNADSTNQQRLTSHSAQDANPDWSPDGTEIAFISMRDGNYEIYLMDADDGDNQRRLTYTSVHAIQPDWYPFGVVGIGDGGGGGDDVRALPKTLQLFPNYPNPFNPSTTIRYDLDRDSAVRLQIFDVRGRKIRTLADGESGAGSYSVTWDGLGSDGNRVASGIYIYRLTVTTDQGTFENSRKMVVVK